MLVQEIKVHKFQIHRIAKVDPSRPESRQTIAIRNPFFVRPQHDSVRINLRENTLTHIYINLIGRVIGNNKKRGNNVF